MEVRYLGSYCIRVISVALAVAGLFLNSVEYLLFAIYLWLVAGSVERLYWMERAEREHADHPKGNPWDHVSR